MFIFANRLITFSRNMKVTVSDEIENVCPGFVGACIEANVRNTDFCKPLWDEINAMGEHYRAVLTVDSSEGAAADSRHKKGLPCLRKRPVALSPRL